MMFASNPLRIAPAATLSLAIGLAAFGRAPAESHPPRGTAGSPPALTLPVAAMLLQQQSLVLSPEQFGARGDGVSDDAAAFRAALAVLGQAGGGTLAGRPGATYRINSAITLANLSNINLAGNGARIFRFTPGSAANALTVTGSDNIAIEGWAFDSSYNGFARGSTGSNPNIFLGVGRGSPNRNIRITGNRFSNGNHANITIGTTGVDALLPARGIANEDIRIERNTLGNAGVGVFVYKAARRVTIADNVGANFSAVGIAVDSAAATDPDRGSYTVDSVVVRRNALSNIVGVGRFAARGIVLKGALSGITVEDNRIDRVQSSANVETYGILVTEDQGPTHATGRGIRITGNIVNDVSASAPGATGAWPLAVNRGFSDVQIRGNSFRGGERGVRLSDQSEWQLTGNRLEDLATAAGTFPIHVAHAGPASRGDRLIDGNELVRGRGVAAVAISANGAAGPAVRLGANRMIGFPAAPAPRSRP